MISSLPFFVRLVLFGPLPRSREVDVLVSSTKTHVFLDLRIIVKIYRSFVQDTVSGKVTLGPGKAAFSGRKFNGK